MSENRGAVEKVVETLFFTLLYISNPDRDFFYAPLDGVEESFFGDALAIADKVFAFEFKRSLESITSELEKYGVKTEAEFAALMPAAPGLQALRLLSQKGHVFVTLQQDAGAGLGPVCAAGIAELIESATYLDRLLDKSHRHSPAKTKEISFFDHQMGLSLDEAEDYFHALGVLRGEKGKSGGKEADTGLIVGFFVSNTGALAIVTADGYLNLLELVRSAQRLNQVADIASNASRDARQRSGPGP